MRVPTARGPVVPFPRPKADPLYLALAAAEMDSKGRLFEPDVAAQTAPAQEPPK